MTALNGAPQDYTAFLLPSGLLSAARSARRSLHRAGRRFAPYRDDVRALRAETRVVFRTPRVIVHERDSAPPHAWIVHDVRPVTRGEALPSDQRSRRSLSDGARRGGPPVTAAPEEPRPSRHESPRTNRTG